MSNLEAALALAQKSFTDYFFDTTASIHALTIKMGALRGTVVDVPFEEALKSLGPPLVAIEEIQHKLSESVHRKSMSIRRSLLKLSNLSAQYSLLNLPYYELKAYNQQIGQIQKQQNDDGKLSYQEALHSLEQIIQDVEEVHSQTALLVTRDNYLQPFLALQPSDFATDEYKTLPSLQF